MSEPARSKTSFSKDTIPNRSFSSKDGLQESQQKQPRHARMNRARFATRSAVPKDLLSLSSSELIKTMAVMMPAIWPNPGTMAKSRVRNTFSPLLSGARTPLSSCSARVPARRRHQRSCPRRHQRQFRACWRSKDSGRHPTVYSPQNAQFFIELLYKACLLTVYHKGYYSPGSCKTLFCRTDLKNRPVFT